MLKAKKPRRQKLPKNQTIYYELRECGMNPGTRCIECERTIVGPSALWVALDGMGPFCYHSCVAKYFKVGHAKQGKDPDAAE